ncbi:hypothetical protein SESBI_33821 [Sesbania bispinosa]|nr:hypothetical protein SESBI_33821 [Sesbania bispinosa]
MVCQLESTSTDSSECSFSEGEDYDNGAYLFKDMLQDYVEGNGNSNLKCQLLENSLLSPINGDIKVPDCDINSELLPENAGVHLDASKELLLDPNLKAFDKGTCGTNGKFLGENLVEVVEPPAHVCVDKPILSKQNCPFLCASAVPRSDDASDPITIAYASDPIPNVSAELRSEVVVGPIACTVGPNPNESAASPSPTVNEVLRIEGATGPSSHENAANPFLSEDPSNLIPIEDVVRPSEGVAGPVPTDGAVRPSLCSPLGVMFQVGTQQMQGPNYYPMQGRGHSLPQSHYSEALVEVREIEGFGITTQLEVVGGQKRGRGRPRKRVHAKPKVSNLPLNVLPDAVLIEEDPQLVANKVWLIGQKLGVTLEGESVEMVQQLTEMEERDRKVVGRIRSVGGT